MVDLNDYLWKASKVKNDLQVYCIVMELTMGARCQILAILFNHNAPVMFSNLVDYLPEKKKKEIFLTTFLILF